MNSSAKLIPVNSVIVSSRATIGRIGINRIELATNQGFKIIVIKDFEKVIPEFVALMMTKLKDRMVALASGGTFKEISKANFSSLEIPLPSLSEQQEIVNQIEQEQLFIESNKESIRISENKIKAVIDNIWNK